MELYAIGERCLGYETVDGVKSEEISVWRLVYQLRMEIPKISRLDETVAERHVICK